MSTSNAKQLLQAELEQIESFEAKIEYLNDMKSFLHGLSPHSAMPVDVVKWVPIELVQANDYNPNAVAKNEMRLLLHSVQEDGYTQPIVTVFDEEKQRYVVVDGFHRYTVCRENTELRKQCHGCVPVVVLKKGMADRMASTVRHNRARGKHSIAGMANLIFQMLDEGKSDEEICHNLGMEADELLRLKHITGFSKLFENVEYRKSWETSKQLKIRQDWEKAHPNEKSDAQASKN